MTRGLNGEIVFSAEDVRVGTVPGADYGYKQRCPVTVSVRIERNDRQDSYETVDHEQVTGPLAYSITTAVWRPNMSDSVAGGATVDPLREVISAGSIASDWDAGRLTELIDSAQWHLNTMTAGCEHQEAVTDGDGRPDLDRVPACPVTGYRYGHAWLTRLLPDGFADRISGIFR